MLNWLKKILKGMIRWTSLKLKYYGGLAALIIYSTRNYFTDDKGRERINRVITMQVYFTGNMALKLVGMVALALGVMTVLPLFTQLTQFGALDYVGKILNIVIVRELGPVITALIVISRSGSAIAAEIGTMMVNDEVNALEMLGIDTLKFIVFPRIAGMVIAMVLLTVYFNAIGLIGGFFVGSIYADLNFDMFTTYVMNSISILDIFISILKSAAFGIFISAIAIYYGFQAFVSTQIPQVTTKAVVSSIFSLFFIDILITVITYL